MQTLTLLLDRLVEGGVDFVVIGGYAAVLHGSSQVMQDLDIITEVTGVGDYDRVRAKSQSVLLSGHTVQVIALEDLILAKQALGRGKDLITAAELRVIALRQGLSPPV